MATDRTARVVAAIVDWLRDCWPDETSDGRAIARQIEAGDWRPSARAKAAAALRDVPDAEE